MWDGNRIWSGINYDRRGGIFTTGVFKKEIDMAIAFTELFIATLSTLSLDKKSATELKTTDIDDLFKKILEAQTLCRKTFNDQPSG